jgi:hypothetical protein
MVTDKIDVYSFGIVMWELLTGDEPYADMHCGSITGGNQKAKEIYFKDFDPRHQLPDSSNVDRLRDFIKHVYVDKRYSGDRGGDRPPRGKTGDRDDASESRKPDSFRSDSRSPPYEDEYGDRRSGDRSGSGARQFKQSCEKNIDGRSKCSFTSIRAEQDIIQTLEQLG